MSSCLLWSRHFRKMSKFFSLYFTCFTPNSFHLLKKLSAFISLNFVFIFDYSRYSWTYLREAMLLCVPYKDYFLTAKKEVRHSYFLTFMLLSLQKRCAYDTFSVSHMLTTGFQ